MNINVAEGKKDGSSYYFCGDGFYYYFNKGNSYNEGISSIFYLRCSKYSKRGCTGTAKIESTPEGVQWTNLQRHTCAPNPTLHAVRQLRREILDASVENMGPYETPAEVVRRVRHRYHPNIAAQVTSDRMRSAIRRKRMKMYPRVPDSLYNLGGLLNDDQLRNLTRCQDGVDNIFGGRCIGPNGTSSIVFVSRRIRRFMRRCRTVFCDGTFGSRPNAPNSGQVLQIVAVHRHAAIPLVQILMTGKTENEYVAVLNHLRMIVPQFRPNVVITDFETGLQNAWRRVYNATVRGCYWHFCRAVSKTSREMLAAVMRENRVVKSIVRSTMAIPLLPTNLMARGLQSLMREAAIAGVNGILEGFFNYFIDTWFSPTYFGSLSVYGIRHRTNNVCESCNRLLRSLTGAHRPGLWHFLNALKRYEHDARLTIRRVNLGLTVNRRRKTSAINNDTRIRNLTYNVMTGVTTINRFLHLASTRVLGVFDNFNGA